MAFAVGIGLALLTAVFARLAGLDRDRAFYPTVAIVVASYYLLFAAMGGSTHALLAESVGFVAFAALAVVGFRRSFWLVVLALAGHGVFDAVHGSLVTNPGVPAWWPAFCGSFDVAIGGALAWLIGRSHVASRRAVAGVQLPRR